MHPADDARVHLFRRLVHTMMECEHVTQSEVLEALPTVPEYALIRRIDQQRLKLEIQRAFLDRACTEAGGSAL